MKSKPFFIAIDGIDGCGSSTHSRLLFGFLEYKGYKVHLTQEPSKSEVGQLLRKYLKNKSVPASTDALLFAADRDIHYHNEIKPKLDEGHIVISDRYLESSIVYQSSMSDKLTIDWIEKINKFVREPDLTIILDIDPKLALSRKDQTDIEKFEEVKFLEKVRKLYLSRAKVNDYEIINSDDIIELVQDKIQKIVLKKLSELANNNQ